MTNETSVKRRENKYQEDIEDLFTLIRDDYLDVPIDASMIGLTVHVLCSYS